MNPRFGLLLATLALGIAYPGSARADQLDKKLTDEMPAIYDALKDKGYKNVGVLRFRVQKGTKTARFDNAPLNGNLATRLENLLVLQGDPDVKKAMGVIHEPGTIANKEKVGGWYSNLTERKKLFTLNYPLAWGKTQVKADAFLTGLVKTSGDLKKVSFHIVCFDKDNPAEYRIIKSFTLKTERNLLRDLGYSYALTSRHRKSLVTRRSAEDVDQNVVDTTQENDAKEDIAAPDSKTKPGDDEKPPEDFGKDEAPPTKDAPPTQPATPPSDKPGKAVRPALTQVSPSNIAGIEVRMLVDNVGQEIRPAADGDGPRWQVESPRPGKPVVITLKNTTEKVLGVVLKINGFSTVDQQNQPSEACKKWVIPAGKTYTIKGFHMSESDDGPTNDEGDKPAPKKVKVSVHPFKVLAGEEANAFKAQYGDKFGLIEVDVFAEGAETTTEDPGLQVSAKGLPPSKEKLARGSHKALRTALLKSSNLKTEKSLITKRAILVPDPEKVKVITGLTKVDFVGHNVGHAVIKIVPNESKPIEE